MRWLLLMILAVGGCGDSGASPGDTVDANDATDAETASDVSVDPDGSVDNDTDLTGADTPDTPLVVPANRELGDQTFASARGRPQL